MALIEMYIMCRMENCRARHSHVVTAEGLALRVRMRELAKEVDEANELMFLDESGQPWQ